MPSERPTTHVISVQPVFCVGTCHQQFDRALQVCHIMIGGDRSVFHIRNVRFCCSQPAPELIEVLSDKATLYSQCIDPAHEGCLTSLYGRQDGQGGSGSFSCRLIHTCRLQGIPAVLHIQQPQVCLYWCSPFDS